MTVEKSRGRIEVRELWVVAAGELGPYLATVWGWQHVQQIGWVRRRRQRHAQAAWEEQWVTVVTSVAAEGAPPAKLLQLLRQHWVIENRVHRVRDVSYDEDRSHGRQRAQVLAWVRNTAISLFRWRGFRYIPDGWRWTSRQPQAALQWLM